MGELTVALIASTGGHLVELQHLRPRMSNVSDAVWITFDTPQSRDLLRDEPVVFVPVAAPRKLGAAIGNLRRAPRILREHDIEAVISTGASVAVSFMYPARAMGIPCYYIESAARASGPSLTGRLLRPLPGVNLCTQHRGWAQGKWGYAGSVFDGFVAGDRPQSGGPLKVVVTLGTQREFPFPRMVESVIDALPANAEVLWQTGATDVSALGINGYDYLDAHHLYDAIRDADVVISHAGVGSAITALELGKIPILIPRSQQHTEHVDDHQSEIAAELEARGIALARTPDELTRFDLERVAGLRATAQLAAALDLRRAMVPPAGPDEPLAGAVAG